MARTIRANLAGACPGRLRPRTGALRRDEKDPRDLPLTPLRRPASSPVRSKSTWLSSWSAYTTSLSSSAEALRSAISRMSCRHSHRTGRRSHHRFQQGSGPRNRSGAMMKKASIERQLSPEGLEIKAHDPPSSRIGDRGAHRSAGFRKGCSAVGFRPWPPCFQQFTRQKPSFVPVRSNSRRVELRSRNETAV